MTKQELRQFMRRQKSGYVEHFPVWSESVCRAIRQTAVWQSAHTVLLYHALPDEPRLDELFSEPKVFLLPVVVGNDLVLRQYRGDAEMQEGAFHIQEPIGEDFPLQRYSEIELALVPGVAFDGDGHRLGRGRGYYDRLLPRLPKTYKLGVCFPFQILDSIPSEPHDVCVDGLCL